MLMATSASMAADGYHLDAMDKLRIRVAEWQSAEGAVRDWATISGDYSVNPAGEISLPFVGELGVKGKTTTEVATAIAVGLQQKLGLPDRPEASVEIAEYRPVFLAGDVQTPGKYPYAPGLTVLKAMSLAGGLRRADSGQGGVRDFIQAQGNYDVLIAQRNGLLARRARLIAEAENRDQIDFPPELNKTDVGRKLMADETALKEARENRLRLQLTALDDLKKLLQSEIESLSKKIVTQNRQVELSKDELKSISGLAEKGLVVNQRIMSLERTSAELEGKVLDLETASLRAKQDISKATQDATKLQNDRDTEVAQSRQQTEADLEEMGFKVGMYSGLMTEAMTRAPDAARTANNGAEPVIRYAIVRTDEDGKASEVAADENTPILPGDVVKIEIAGPGVTSN